MDKLNLPLAISMLEDGHTKKSVCDAIGIRYNTKRLNKLIEDFNDRKAYIKKRHKDNAGKPLTILEKKEIIIARLTGTCVSDIAKTLYRGTQVIKDFILNSTPLDLKDTVDYCVVDEVNDKYISEEYNKDDLVYSLKYNEAALVIKEWKEKVYSIWLLRSSKFCYQPNYALADMTQLQNEFNLDIKPQTGIAARGAK